MSERMKILVSFALLGFVAGITANIAYHTVWPLLLSFFPEILQMEWVLSGIAGATLTLIMLILWAYLSK